MEAHGKELILQAARQQLEEEGADSLSVRTVARRAHYSPAGMYRHFASIEALRLALVHQIAEDFRLAYIEQIGDGPAPTSKAIANYTAEWVEQSGHVAELLLSQPAADFWPADSQLDWMDSYPDLRDVDHERRRILIILAWDSLRSILMVRSMKPDLDHAQLFDDYMALLRDKVKAGIL